MTQTGLGVFSIRSDRCVRVCSEKGNLDFSVRPSSWITFGRIGGQLGTRFCYKLDRENINLIWHRRIVKVVWVISSVFGALGC